MQTMRNQDASTATASSSPPAAVGGVTIARDMLAVVVLVLLGGIAATLATGNPQFITVTAGASVVAVLLDALSAPRREQDEREDAHG